MRSEGAAEGESTAGVGASEGLAPRDLKRSRRSRRASQTGVYLKCVCIS
jgi:hypothetical protein